MVNSVFIGKYSRCYLFMMSVLGDCGKVVGGRVGGLGLFYWVMFGREGGWVYR